ncbi:MAG: flagellar type III secretion system pore protein FliP [Oscillospiraceae bacterium]|nr:flagellar type III secretion system pore protein FliP [Oscillospiraceae bacterium]
MKRKLMKAAAALSLLVCLVVFMTTPALAAITDFDIGGGPTITEPNISINLVGEESDAVRIVLLLTVLSVLPSVLIMMTSFTRIVIVFSLLRNALGLQQTPPNQVLVGLALFLSLFIMTPTFMNVNDNALQPYVEGEIGTQEFLDRATGPMRTFMLNQTTPSDLNMFLILSGAQERPENPDDIPMTVVIPSFITSELKRAFTMGFLLFLPFMVIDIVVASALMSMGMMMMPPITISLPFKMMLFVLVDGWGLLIQTLVRTYNM